jgi:hypothetical protein
MMLGPILDFILLSFDLERTAGPFCTGLLAQQLYAGFLVPQKWRDFIQVFGFRRYERTITLGFP